jgi:hypothetical protein
MEIKLGMVTHACHTSYTGSINGGIVVRYKVRYYLKKNKSKSKKRHYSSNKSSCLASKRHLVQTPKFWQILLFAKKKKKKKKNHSYSTIHLMITIIKILNTSQALVVHACNPSYSGGRNQEDGGSKPVRANSLRAPILEKTHHKKGLME